MVHRGQLLVTSSIIKFTDVCRLALLSFFIVFDVSLKETENRVGLVENITGMPAVSMRKLTIVSGYRCVLLIVGLICCVKVSETFLTGTRVSRIYKQSYSSREVVNIAQRGRDLTTFASEDDQEIDSIPFNDGEVLKDFLDISDITENIGGDLVDEESSTEESNDLPAQRQLVWNAAVKSSVRVKELERTVEEYMRLPASECESLDTVMASRCATCKLKMRLRMLILLTASFEGYSSYTYLC